MEHLFEDGRDTDCDATLLPYAGTFRKGNHSELFHIPYRRGQSRLSEEPTHLFYESRSVLHEVKVSFFIFVTPEPPEVIVRSNVEPFHMPTSDNRNSAIFYHPTYKR